MLGCQAANQQRTEAICVVTPHTRRVPNNHQSRNAARFQLARRVIPSLRSREDPDEGVMIGVLAGLVFLLLCIPLLPGGLDSGVQGRLGGLSSTAGMALNAAVATAGLHLLLTHFPRCFTLGR